MANENLRGAFFWLQDYFGDVAPVLLGRYLRHAFCRGGGSLMCEPSVLLSLESWEGRLALFKAR